MTKSPQASNSIKLEPKELLSIAACQKRILWLMLGALAFFWVFAPRLSDSMMPLVFLLSTCLAVLNTIFIYKLASSLKSKWKWLFVILGAIPPLVALIPLAILDRQATVVLRENGVRVGFLGAPAAESARLAAEASESGGIHQPLPPVLLPAPESPSKAHRQGWAEDLRELAKLRDDGIITDQEFNDKKKVIMGL